jgi:hypothetical protein
MARSLLVSLVVIVLLGVGCSRQLTIDIEGGGSVLGADKETLCAKAQCVLELDKGSEVSLVAKPPDGARFEGWSGACKGKDGCTVSLEDNHRVGARFVRTAYLSVEVDGDGKGVLESGIDCPKGCSLELQEGVKVELEAKPEQGMEFTGWGGACTGTGICSVSVTGEVKVTATFSIPLGTKLSQGKLEVSPGHKVVGIVGLVEEVVTVSSGADGVQLVRSDQGGNRHWAKLPDKELFSEVRAVVPMPDEELIAGGVANKSDCALAQFDKEGKPRWKVLLPDCGSVDDIAVTGTPGSEVIVALGTVGAFGSSFDFLGTALKMKGNADAFLARFDTTGQLSSVINVGTRKGDQPRSFALSPDGSVAYVDMCAGKECRIVAVSADGSEAWERKYPSKALTVHDMAATRDHVFVVGDGAAKQSAAREALHAGAVGRDSCAGTSGVWMRLNAGTGSVEQGASYGASLIGVRAREDAILIAGALGPDESFGDKRMIAGGAFDKELVEDCDAKCKPGGKEPKTEAAKAKLEACMTACKGSDKSLEERCKLTSTEAFAAGIDVDGKPLWSSFLDDKHPIVAEAMGIDDEGRVYVLGTKPGEKSEGDDDPASMAWWVRFK